MALPFWPFVRVQALNGTLVGVLSAAVFFLAAHDLPTGPLVAWTMAVGVLVSCAAALAGAVVLRRRVVVRDDAPGKAREYPRNHVEILAAVFGGMSSAEIGSIVNDDANSVQRIREGSKPWTKDHDIWLAKRRPDLYAEMDKRVRGVL